MTSATVRRGSQPRRRAPAKKTARAKKNASFSAQMAEIVPLEEATIRRLAHWAVICMIALFLLIAAIFFRVPQMIGWQIGEGVGKLGFTVERVEIQGIDRMERLPVYAVALDQESMAMPNVDIDEIRRRVEAFPWVGEARVSRRLPDTLVVAITERVPSAIWQHNQQLFLVDTEGEVLEEVPLDAMPDLPLIIGPGANRQVANFETLMDRAPALKPLLEGATWVGNRRWDLRFSSGEVLALPEGQEEAARALVRFARMDGVTGLLGEGAQRFDMRVPERFVVRVPQEQETIAEPSAETSEEET
ncbi:MAG: cell division protein FtsQ/DivIB [Parasphingopyxis sp.]|uniref:cell division protein FtsQ/DivIB n=1 Tax=Parasphingopyxis sp. TaxID=1920299 RepID=UPI0032EDA9DA